jgi:hypothetical protein
MYRQLHFPALMGARTGPGSVSVPSVFRTSSRQLSVLCAKWLLRTSCLLSWNVRGLNAQVRRSGVRDMVAAVKATVACLQETKLQAISEAMVAEMLGERFMNCKLRYQQRRRLGCTAWFLVDLHISSIMPVYFASVLLCFLQVISLGARSGFPLERPRSWATAGSVVGACKITRATFCGPGSRVLLVLVTVSVC